MTTPSTAGPTAGSQNDHDGEAEASATTTRPARRRATRTTSAPTTTAGPIIIKATPAAEPSSPAVPASNVVAGTGSSVRPRRRATRGSAAPAAPAEHGAARDTPAATPVVGPDSGSEPVSPSSPAPEPAAAPSEPAAESAGTAETPTEPTETAVAAGGTAGTAAPALPEPTETAAAPKRRSRRVTKPAGAAEKAQTARRSRSAAPVATDDVAAPGDAAPAGPAVPDEAPASAAADAPARKTEAAAAAGPTVTSGTGTAAEKPARARRSRSRKAAEPAAVEPAAAEPAAAEPAAAEPEAAEPEAAEPDAAAAPTGGAVTRQERTAPRTRATRRSGTAPASSDPGAGDTKDERPRTAPRLATTALLFQAPDLAAVRRPRSEPGLTMPGARGVIADTASGTDTPAEAPAEAPTDAVEGQETDGTRSSEVRTGTGKQGSASRRSGRAAGEPVHSAAAGDTAGAAPRFQAAELSDDDAAAVDEVGVIEDELVAEGVELAELGPEDLDEEEDFEEDDSRPNRRRRRRGGRGRRGGRARDARPDDEPTEPKPADEQGDESPVRDEPEDHDDGAGDDGDAGSRRRRRRRRGSRAERAEAARSSRTSSDEVTALKGSTRLEAKRQRRREGRDAGRRRQIVTEAEFLARRESVTRSMVVREQDGRTQIAVLEDGVLVEHYVSQQSQTSMAGNVYLGRVQNVLPSMEAAFVDIGKGRNAVLYAGEVNWDAAGIADGQPRRIEEALKSGDTVLVQVTKDPIGHKGARLTSQVTLAGRYLVFVPGGGMTGISRKLPDTERNRLKKILREVVPDGAGVIVRTAAEGASEEELRADVERLQSQWDAITTKADRSKKSAPVLLQGEPDLAIRVVRDIFNDDFSSLVVAGERAWGEISAYVDELAPDLRERVTKWAQPGDVFAEHRVDEQLAKGMDRKVWLPSGGSLVIDRTEAMTVVDVNTGKFTGAGGTLEETVTRNNLEAAEEIVRQLRLRDIGGIIVIDFIDMVLESNRDLVLRRLVECLGRDRTKHQVAEVTSLGLVQMTRKRVGQGLVEAFSETCEHCNGRGFVVHDHPIERGPSGGDQGDNGSGNGARKRRKKGGKTGAEVPSPAKGASHGAAVLPEESSEERADVKARLATIAAAAQHAHEDDGAKGGADAVPDVDPAADSGRSAAPAAEPVAEPRPEPKFELDLPVPKTDPGERAASRPSASLDAIVLPDRSAKPEEAPATSGNGPEVIAERSDGEADGGDTPEPPKGAGDEVA
ncbi:Rne/Rng family ribonuclease [Myceligenerans salitolerans]|uniref:Ribonuclease E/G n=1 Tax=Myceligenerans salitolerans TaxID=1230528 RepID=A0ABS3I3S9_9MICO|nr:Rne/Rng family ribonuclease [Myceligenerans salitolerans]MBO0607656.1 ribonuclease E/G [Myceligenerans salitolerans]